MNWNGFTAIPNGTRILNHGWDQCVALANLYHESVIGGSFVPVGSAYQWYTEFYRHATLVNNYVLSPSPVAGAIFVARGGIYDLPNGHIGVVTSVSSNGTFNTMEQNAGTWRYVGRYTRGLSNILGFLVPKNNPATPSHNTTPEEKIYDEEEELMAVYFEATSNSSPLTPGNDSTSRIWAGSGRVLNGARYSGVWERSEDGSLRRLFEGEWAGIQAAFKASGRKVPLARVHGNVIEQMYLVQRYVPKR